MPSALGLFSGLLHGDVVDEGDAFAELQWSSGSRLRIETSPDAPGVDRLEVEGLAEACEHIGTRFVPVTT